MNNKYYDRIKKENIEDKAFFEELDYFALRTGRSYAMPDKEYRTIRRIWEVRDYLGDREVTEARKVFVILRDWIEKEEEAEEERRIHEKCGPRSRQCRCIYTQKVNEDPIVDLLKYWLDRLGQEVYT